MPVADDTIKSSWADEIEVDGELPPPTIKIDGETKTVTEYSYNDDDRKVKIISHYRIEKHRVCKTIAERKLWKKFGSSKDDKPGPNPATTITAEEVFLQFLTKKDEQEQEQDELKKKLIDSQKGTVKCRLCKEDHWTTHCPYKTELGPLTSSLLSDDKEGEGNAGAGNTGNAPEKKVGGSLPGKYVPPSMRDGASKKGESMMSNRDEVATVRVTNLSENTREQDLHELFSNFGDLSRIFLAKDKNTGASKGFAFINFKRREHAAAAIERLNGYGYDHLILSVEWARPTNNN